MRIFSKWWFWVLVIAVLAGGVGLWLFLGRNGIGGAILIGDPTVNRSDGSGVDFEIAVSPQDSEGNPISENVGEKNFSFLDVKVSAKNADFQTKASVAVSSIEIITPPEKGIDMALAFDNSGSMGMNEEQISRLREDGSLPNDPDRLSIAAGKNLIDLIGANGRAQITTFGTAPGESPSVYATLANLEVALKVVQDFTGDKSLLGDKIEEVDVFNGWYGTPLFNALNLSLDSLFEREDQSRTPVIVAMADGEDNWSGVGATRESVVSKAQRRNTPIFSVAFGDENTDNLQFISRETGGIFAHSEDAEGLAALFESIGIGIFQGRVVVVGKGSCGEEISRGDYVVTGTLRTSIGFKRVDTPFSFEITVE